jgi:hypothetical protein
MKSIVPRLAFSCTTLYVRFLAENARFVAANISNYCRTKNDPFRKFSILIEFLDNHERSEYLTTN